MSDLESAGSILPLLGPCAFSKSDEEIRNNGTMMGATPSVGQKPVSA